MTIYQRIKLSSTGNRMLLLMLVVALTAREGKSLSDASVDAPTIITRSEWGAKSATRTAEPLTVDPAPYVIIHHAASDTCTNRAICQARLRSFQNHHMNTNKWDDIGYNFLVGEEGNIYEGRGWGKTGAHTKTYNKKSIGICIIGNYENRVPNTVATDALKKFISYGVSLGKISTNYSLIGHKQAWATDCPGKKLYQLIQTWPNYVKNP